MSLEVIGTVTDRSATYNFLLVFHNKYGTISYRVRDEAHYLKYFPPLYM